MGSLPFQHAQRQRSRFHTPDQREDRQHFHRRGSKQRPRFFDGRSPFVAIRRARRRNQLYRHHYRTQRIRHECEFKCQRIARRRVGRVQSAGHHQFRFGGDDRFDVALDTAWQLHPVRYWPEWDLGAYKHGHAARLFRVFTSELLANRVPLELQTGAQGDGAQVAHGG